MLRPLTTLLLLIVVLLHEISYQMIIPIIETLVQQIQQSPNHQPDLAFLQGISIALFTVSAAVGAPLMGYCSDRWGRKKILLTCLLLLLVSCVVLSTALFLKSLALFWVGRLLSGFAGSEIADIQGYFAAASHGHERAVHFSQIGLMLTLGTIIGPLMGGYLTHLPALWGSPLQWPFIIVALLTLATLLWLLPINISSKGPYETEQTTATQGFWWFCSAFFLLELSWSFYFQLIPVTLKTQFLEDSAHTGAWMSVMGIAMCVALFSYRFLAKIFSNKQMANASLGLCIVAALLKGITVHVESMAIDMVLMAIGVALSYIAIMALYAQSVKLSYQGMAMGLTLSLMAIAWTVTGSFARVLYGYSETLCVALIAGGFLLTLGVLRRGA
jgi:MFS transporter, DHA1 family, tetracycline resistance protein